MEKMESKPLGRGGFGEVWKVRCSDGQIRAAKYFNKQRDSLGQTIKNGLEAETNLFNLDHKNVVKVFDVIMEDSTPVLIMELVEGQSLKKCMGRLSGEELQDVCRQTLSGLAYLHSRNPPVIHRDLKPDNIMLAADGTVKLIDFGLSVKLGLMTSGKSYEDFVHTTLYPCGTMDYMAPELFQESRPQYSTHSDVWAFGCTVYALVTGKDPHSCSSAQSIIDRIASHGAPDLPESTSRQLRDFYKCCVAMEPRSRWSASRLLQEHPFAR